MKNNPKIRLATPEDASEILEIYSPYIDTVVTFEEEVPSIPDFQKRIAGILEDCPFLVCEIEGVIVGYAYASTYRERASYRWNREISVYIRDGFMRKRIAHALYHALFNILKKQNIANLLAVITLPNTGSVALHESMGFKSCAVFNKIGYKQNKWHQVGWWELFLFEENWIPKETVPFPKLQGSINLDKILKQAATLIKT